MAVKRPPPAVREFAELVLEMLIAQRRYFSAPRKTPAAQEALVAAKELETRARDAANQVLSAPEETREPLATLEAECDRLIARAKRRIRLMERLPILVALIAIAGAVTGCSAPATLVTVVVTTFSVLAYLVCQTWLELEIVGAVEPNPTNPTGATAMIERERNEVIPRDTCRADANSRLWRLRQAAIADILRNDVPPDSEFLVRIRESDAISNDGTRILTVTATAAPLTHRTT